MVKSAKRHLKFHVCHHDHHHHIICHTIGPQPLPKPVLHTVRSSASSFNFQYPLVFLVIQQLLTSSFSSFLPFFFVSSITCCIRQSLCKMYIGSKQSDVIQSAITLHILVNLPNIKFYGIPFCSSRAVSCVKQTERRTDRLQIDQKERLACGIDCTRYATIGEVACTSRQPTKATVLSCLSFTRKAASVGAMEAYGGQLGRMTSLTSQPIYLRGNIKCHCESF
jgi:L-lactate permease